MAIQRLTLSTGNESIRPPIVFCRNGAYMAARHGSSKTQNFKDAVAHAQSGEPLASPAADQVFAMRKPGSGPLGLSFLRLLQRPPGADRRRQSLTEDFLLQMRAKVRKISF